MSQTLSHNLLHVVFSTRNRENRLFAALRPDLFALMASLSDANRCHVYRAGGVDDHVHLAVRLHQGLALSRYLNLLKTETSKWIKSQPGSSSSFAWQKGYGAFSVSATHLPALVHYIENQESHHHGISFQDEFRFICKKCGVEIDERYVWD